MLRGLLIDLGIALACGAVAGIFTATRDLEPPPPPSLTTAEVDGVFSGELALARDLGFEMEERRVEAGAEPWSEELSVEAGGCLDVVATSGVDAPIWLSIARDGHRGLADGPDHVVHVQICEPQAATLRATIQATSRRPALRVAVGRSDVVAIGGEARLTRPDDRPGWLDEERRGHERVMARARAGARTAPAVHQVTAEAVDGVRLWGPRETTCVAATRLIDHPKVEGEPCPGPRGTETMPHTTAQVEGQRLRVLAIFDPDSLDRAARIEATRLLENHRPPPLYLIRVPIDGTSRPRAWAALEHPDREGWVTQQIIERDILAIAVPRADHEAWELRVVQTGAPLEGPPRGAASAGALPSDDELCEAGDGASCGLAGYERTRRNPTSRDALDLFARGCDLGDGRSCAALAIRRDDSVSLFARGCFAGYANACRSAIYHSADRARFEVDGETRTRLQLVSGPPDDRRIPRVGDTVPADCVLMTYAEHAGQLLCGRSSVGTWGSVQNHNQQRFLNAHGDAALLFGALPWQPPPSTSASPPSFWPGPGRSYVLPRALMESGTRLPDAPGATVNGALPTEGILVTFAVRDTDRTVWMDLATHRTILWLDDLPVAELRAAH